MKAATAVQWVLALGGFAVLAWDAAARIPERYPGILRCLKDPAGHVGRDVFIRPRPVIDSDDRSFVVGVRSRPVRVFSPLRPAGGEYVIARGSFRADGAVDAARARVIPAYRWRRAGAYAVSVITLLVLLVAFGRAFEWREGSFHPRGPWRTS